MEKNTAVTHVLPTQTQVVMQAPQQTRVAAPVSLTRANRAENIVGGATGDIVLRAFCLVFCLAVLIAAAVTLAAINTVNSFAIYVNSSSYKAVAGWLMFVAITAIIFHALMIFIRILYVNSTIEKNFSGYTFTSAILCGVFVLAFLSGGISSAVYAFDNIDNHDAVCSGFSTSELCDDLQTVYTSELAAAAFSFMSVLALVPLFITTLCSGIRKWQEEANQSSRVITASAPPYVPLPSSNW